jgi:uncharacterized membrane protein YsdA (DUF1294 family)
MSSQQRLFIYYVIAINVIAYVVMWYDKYQAINKRQRISENKLFLLAILFGSIGIFAGMKAPIYHKAAKPIFKIGIPLLIVLNVVVVYFVFKT